MTTNAPNLPDGLEYCEEDECFNIVPGGGVCDDCRARAPRLADQPPMRSTPVTGPTYTDLAREVDRLKDLCKTLNRRDGEIRQQAFLDLAHELSEMTPAARDAAIRRIIDNAQ